MDIAEQIKIRKRVDAATPPPWKDCKSIHGSEYRYVQIGKDEMYSTLELKPDDARFIAHAREDVDHLLDALGLLRAKFALLRQFALDESDKWEGRNPDRMYEANVFLHEIDR